MSVLDAAARGRRGGAGERPSTPDALADPHELARRIEALTVRVDQVSARTAGVHVAGYPDGPRPTSIVRLEGGGEVGIGECVDWTAGAQEHFCARVAALLPAGGRRLGELRDELRRATDEPYERAALELAAIDLALRQAGTNLFRLASRAPQPVAHLSSFALSAEPLPAVRAILAASPAARLKLDLDPSWPPEGLAELDGAERIVVLDCKLRGGPELAERAHAAFPAALIEDPDLGEADAVSASLAARVAFDALVRSAGDVAALPLRPAAVNVKPARMGGLIEALEAIAACRESGIRTYVGGMFEVGPGRAQSQVLASLTSPEAWNDVAPLVGPRVGAGSPLQIPADFIGLGFER